jgi:phage protein D
MITVFSKNQSRTPRFIAKINGISVPVISFEMSSPYYYESDTFELTISKKTFPKEMNNDFWSNNRAFLCEFYLGFPSDPLNYTENDLELMLLAQTDELEIDEIDGTYFLTGRDLSAKLIDNKTTDKFQNQTSSEVAAIFAKRRGLKANITKTTVPVGYYYGIDHVQLETEKTEWDILTYLAQKESFLAYVSGDTLYFNPLPTQQSDSIVFQYENNQEDQGEYKSFNGMSLKLTKDMTIAKDVIVKVRSWNQRQKQGYTVTAKALPDKKTYISSKAKPIGDAQVYSYVVGGLTQEQATKYVQEKLKQITVFQKKIEIRCPGINNLKKNNTITLEGSSAGFDQVYYPSKVTRRINLNEGYIMEIEAKNNSNITQVIL